MLTRDDIISIALAYGCEVTESLSVPGEVMKVCKDGSIAELLEAVAAAAYDASRKAAIAEAVAAEREACARVVDEFAGLREAARNVSEDPYVKLAAGCAMDTARSVATAIRARGEKGGA